MSSSATKSELEKAVIEVLKGKPKELEGSSRIAVEFNPTEYSLEKSIEYGNQKIPGFSSPVTQFVSGDAETLSMELFFDTYEDGEDVREKYTNKIDALLKVDGTIHGPPICRFVWGSFDFKCVLQSANKQFTMFRSNGIPVRARVNVTFKGYTTPEEQSKEEKRESADKTKVRRVEEGESLWSIAAEEYQDPRQWRPIAAANGIENPRRLRPGDEVLVPSLES